MNHQWKRTDTHWISECAIFLTLEIVFLVVPFLQIELGAFTIVFSALPIAVATIRLGLRAAIILGAAWGGISFSQAFTDSFGLVMLNANFIGTFIVLGVSRLLVGVCTAFTYNFLSKFKRIRHISIAITCFMASVFNNLFFMGGMAVFFKDTFLEFIYPILGSSILFNMLPETIVCVILGTAIVTAFQKSGIPQSR